MSEVNENEVSLDLEGRFLTFLLSGQDYGVDILRVIEIVGVIEITPIPRTPDYVKGVMNLRGKIIPIVDLRVMFDLETANFDETTCIIVTEIDGQGSKFLIGAIVDTVSEVIEVNSSNLEKAPSFGEGFDAKHILGMAKAQGSVKTLLDINAILSEAKLTLATD